MLSKVKKQIKQFHMLEKGDRVLIGLSGGADSVCLAQVLYELREEYGLILGAACFDHGIRGEEAALDVEFARVFCEERQILFYTAKEMVEDRAKETGTTVEEAGRAFRYEQFERIMEEEGYHKLAIAHNGDDRAETMLFHLARGTGIAGLSTMEPVRTFGSVKEDNALLLNGEKSSHNQDFRLWKKKIIRPLLTIEKREIEQWLRQKGIHWRVDTTNLSDDYTRNRIRHHILPELAGINDQAISHMGETANRLGEIRSYLEEEENRAYGQSVAQEFFNGRNRLIISVPILESYHIYMKKAVLYRCISEMAGGKKDITAVHVEALLDLLKGGSGKEVSLMKGIRAKKEYDKLIFSQEEAIFIKPENQVEEAAFTEQENQTGEAAFTEQENQIEAQTFTRQQREILDRLSIFMEETPYQGQEILKNEYTKQFDCAKILNRLCVRFWKEGDYLMLREDGGKKKLSRFFIDARIPREERERIPLLADGDHILWIVGHRISAYYKVTEDTKDILTVTIKTKDRKE